MLSPWERGRGRGLGRNIPAPSLPPRPVIPAKAGISRRLHEIPAFAGMTDGQCFVPLHAIRSGSALVPGPIVKPACTAHRELDRGDDESRFEYT